jgi:hypothetical protein
MALSGQDARSRWQSAQDCEITSYAPGLGGQPRWYANVLESLPRIAKGAWANRYSARIMTRPPIRIRAYVSWSYYTRLLQRLLHLPTEYINFRAQRLGSDVPRAFRLRRQAEKKKHADSKTVCK